MKTYPTSPAIESKSLEKPLRWYNHISINLFWLGLNIRNNAVGSIFMPYLVAAFAPEAIKNTALGGMRTAGLIIAMLVQPAMGYMSDRSTSRFGRRRPYIFAGVMLDLLFLVGIAFAWNYSSLLAAVLLFQFSSNVSHGPLQALIPDLVPEAQRGRASAWKAIMELLPLVLIAFTIAKLVGAGQFGWAVVATGVALLVTMLLTMLLVKEQPLKEKPDAPFWPPMLRVLGVLAGILVGAVGGVLGGGLIGGLSWLIANLTGHAGSANAWAVGIGGAVAMVLAVGIGVWAGAVATLGKDARSNKGFTWWVVNRLFFLAAVTSIQSFAPFFLMYAFKITREAAADMTGSLLMAVGIFTLISALPGGWLSDRIGHRWLVGISGIIAAVGAVLLLGTIWLPNMTLLYVVGAILGLATGLFMTTNWALGTKLVPSEESGRYLGISNLAGAGAGIVGTGIGGLVADYLNGYYAGLGYFAIFAAYAVLFIFSTISLRWVKQKQA